MKDKDIIVDDIRVRGVGKSFQSLDDSVFQRAAKIEFKAVNKSSRARESASVYFEDQGRVDTPVFKLEDLHEGDLIEGPALIIDNTQTIVVDPAPVTCKVLAKSLLIEL